MRRLPFGLFTALVLAGVVVGQPPKSPARADTPRVFTGKVVLHSAPPGKSGAKPGDRRAELVGDDGTTHPLIEDDGSRMLFLDSRLRNRPVRLTAAPTPGNKG